MSNWWQRPQRIVQTNLRLVDAELDPKSLAAELRAFGATAMLFNVGGIFAWYPSKLELQAPNPFLDRDLVGEMVEAAHAADIRVIGRYDLSKGTERAYQAHPDWFCQGMDGGPFEYHSTYQACVNGGWYRAQALEVLRETLSRYPLDGLFFNMFGYLRTDYSYNNYDVCHCDNCRRAFRDFSGQDLPRSYDASEPALREYLRFQDTTSQTLRAEFRTMIKDIRPDIAISNMGKDSDFFRGEVNRRLDRPQEWIYQSGEQARTFRSMGSSRIRYSSALTHFVDFPWRYASESTPLQCLRLAQQLANGADPHYYFMGLPSQPDREPLAGVCQIFKLHADYEEQYTDLESAASVALYVSSRSARYGGSESTRAFRGAYQTLIDSGIAFDVVHDSRAVDDDFVAWHQRYDVILVTGAACMSEQEARALDAYVETGGSLLVIGDAGSRAETGAQLPASRLQCLPVTGEFNRHESMRGGYLKVDAASGFGVDTDLVLMDGPYYETTAKPGATTVHTVLLPQRFGPPELCYPEPECQSELPGLIHGTFGQGRVTFIPWQTGALYYSHCLSPHRELISEQVKSIAGPAIASLEGASRAEITVQRQTTSGDLLIHIVNYSGQSGNSCLEPVAIHGARLTLRGCEGMSCRALVDDSAIPLTEHEEPGAKVVEIPPFDAFEVLWLSRKNQK